MKSVFVWCSIGAVRFDFLGLIGAVHVEIELWVLMAVVIVQIECVIVTVEW